MSEENTETKFELPFELKIKGLGPTITFHSIVEIRSWADEERNVWEEIWNEHHGLPQPAPRGLDLTRSNLNNIVTKCDQIESEENPDTKQSFMDQLYLMLELYTDGARTYSKSHTGRWIIREIEKDPQRGLNFLYATIEDEGFVLSDGTLGQVALKKYIHHAAEYILGGRDPQAELSRLGNSFHALESELQDAFDGKEKELNDTLNLSKDHYAQAMEDQAHKYNQAIRVHASSARRLHNLEHTYHKLLQLKEPAEYWSSKRMSHWLGVFGAGLVFGFLIFVGGFILVKLGPGFIDTLPKTTNKDLTFGALALVTIPVLAAAWLLRLISRIFVTNLHLATDASMRSKMISTYLALVNDPGSRVGAEERFLVLNAIFRPTEAHDADAPPPGMIDLLNKLKKPQ